jgi:hypothetical protein
MVINGKSSISYSAMIKSKNLNAFFEDDAKVEAPEAEDE